MRRLAIDFGTSNTVVAEWNEAAQAPRTLRLPAIALAPGEGVPSLVPSLVYAESAERALVGAEVRDAGYDVAGDQRFFAGFKRAIAADIEGFAPKLDGVEHTPRLVGERFLRRVLDAVGATDEVVFTVPVQAFERYLHWLQGLAAEAGIAKVHLLDESTAAALGYQVLVPQALVLVCDFGGGTLDLSLVRTPDPGRAGVALRDGGAGRERMAQVIAKAGQVLGGEDIDHWLVDDFLARHGLSAAEVEEDRLQLKQLAEQVKIRLSSEPSAELTYFSQSRFKTFQTLYSREALEDLLERHNFYLKLQSALDALLRQSESRGGRR
ncbi:MAG TPA: Hsp70 family protein, partial [Oscillatoriaceae cyanobacterium]